MNTRALAFAIWVAAMTAALFAIAEIDAPGPRGDSASVSHQKDTSPKAPTPATRRPVDANPIVFPKRFYSIPAAHRAHAQKTRLSCIDCHTNATTSHASSDWLGPGREQCAQCHAQRFDSQTVSAPLRPHIRFSHQRHAQKGIACEACHGRVNEREDARGLERLPLMASCLQCHSGAKAVKLKTGSDCRFCHFSRGGVILTRFKEGLLVPSNSLGSIEHSGNWMYRHGDAAMNQGTLCSACHKESECVACHNSPLRPRAIHPSDWLALHGIEARQAGSSCVSCHRSQSECLTCHLRAGLSPSGPRASQATRGRFHPPPAVWTDRPRTGRHHAVQARLHLDECVSCHQERDCTVCHATASVGGPGLGPSLGRGISPHPMGFATQCRGVVSKNPRPCLVCHRADDPELIGCR